MNRFRDGETHLPGEIPLPVQFCLSPLNPGLQTHLKAPSELLQVALSLLQLQVILAHSSMSEVQNDNGEKMKIRDISSFLQMLLSLLYQRVIPAYSMMEGRSDSEEGGFLIYHKK